MILADKIINERKKNGWSQEELAEQLDVSRQSVSKWESAQAIPDIQKIIKMAEIFGVSTDYLLKDDMEPEDRQEQFLPVGESAGERKVRRVSMEEANAFLKLESRVTPIIAMAVSLCIVSPVLLIFLAGLSEMPGSGITENAAAAVGICVLLVLVAIAVFLFIATGTKRKPYEYLETETIETEYGVEGMVKEKKNAYEATHTFLTATGVILCILCVIPLVVTAAMEMPDHVIVSMVCVLLVVVALGVNLLIRAGGIWESYEKLLQERDYSIKEKKHSKVIETVSQIYWGVVTAIYLGWSFWTMRWEMTWIIWPVAGVLFGVIVSIVKLIVKNEEDTK